MEDLVVTKLWMLGVILVMVAYGAIALVGIMRDNSDKDSTDTK